MSAVEILPSLTNRQPFDEATYLAFLEGRSEDERWELIDGEPIQMMTPPSMVHQRICSNLERRLNDALETSRPDLDAMREIGLSVSAHPGFRPQADVAIIEGDTNSRYFAERFFLAAEVLSPSNSLDYISKKRERYADCAECLHVLILSQTAPAIEVWSRSSDWQGRVYRSTEDNIILPEFGFSCRFGDLYKNTPIR